MKSPIRLSAIWILLVFLGVLSSVGGTAFAAATSGGAVTPGDATSNSMFEYSVVYTDDKGIYPEYADLYIDGSLATRWVKSQLMDFAAEQGQNLVDGVKITFRMSAGLDTSNTFYPNSLFTWSGSDWHRVYPCSWLTSYGTGAPRGHSWRIEVGYMQEGDPPVLAKLTSAGGGPTVHDSFPGWYGTAANSNRYGGRNDDRDWMWAFPYDYPYTEQADPLKVTPYEVQFPDEGTSTSTYTFRVHYYNRDGSKALGWVLPWYDMWSTAQAELYQSGVMVYLRNLDRPTDTYWGVWRGHLMYKADPAGADGDCDYVLNVLPTGGGRVRTSLNHWRTTWAWTSNTNHYYEALPPGRYEYYFACSDDNFEAFGLDKNSVWPYLDPSPALPTPTAPEDRLFGNKGLNYTTDNVFGYVDKPTYMPGAWSHKYPYDSWQGSSLDQSKTNYSGWPIKYPAYTFPVVNPGLYQVTPLNGASRFLGTLSPYKRAVNPAIPYQDAAGMWRLWSETAGGTDNDTFTFQINYWHSEGTKPSYVRLYVNNSWRAEDGGWKTYDMLPVPPVADANYFTGQIYAIQVSGKTLGYGPHCYYIEASDQTWTDDRYVLTNGVSTTVGSKVIRYPRRPDTIQYDGNTFYDGILPGKSPDANTDVGTPLENDIINGPYINTRPEIVLNSWSVTPTVATSGAEFVYRVTYRDADNQRPFTPYLIIEMDDLGNTFTASMVRAPDSDVPGNSAKTYAEGVVYQFKSSSAPGLRLQTGNRKYRFEFTDDWGRQTNQDDRISGETVYVPEKNSGWIGGPVVSANNAPRLSLGTVLSADGASSEATMWNYKVTYTDLDNNLPSWILVYIGRQDVPNGTIVWDIGHAMDPSLPGDTVYSDGKDYKFSTRLPGSNVQAIKYYHCFVASDGVDTAEYNASTSPSSGMVWKTAQTLTSVGSSTTVFAFAHKPTVIDIPNTSQYLVPTNYANPLVYVGGVLKTKVSDYTLNSMDGTVTFTAPVTGVVTGKYWFGTEPDPSKGPIAVTGNHAPVLLDGKVVPTNGTSTTVFKYNVTYTDADDQAPQFVNAVIDSIPHTMVNVRNSATYKSGVVYECSTTLSTGNHQFYFESSDGASFVLFPTVDPIEGPYVNDRPFFSQAQIIPSGIVDQGQPITYTVTLTDKDNDAPMSDYPVVYVDNPTDADWSGTVGSVSGNKLGDTNQTWTPDQFNGMPVEIDVRDPAGNITKFQYKIDHNTTNELYLVTSDLDVVTVGSSYVIGKLAMHKVVPSDQDYTDGVTYEAKVPSLGLGVHKAHFKAIVNEQTQPGVFTQTPLRAPSSDDLSGPTVQALAPAGNIAPVLTNGDVAPHTGSVGTPFRFAVTYTDANGDSPILSHDGTTGYIRLWIEETPGNWVKHDMATDQDAPQYAAGVEFSTVVSTLLLGPHNYYFEASDGWVSVRFPGGVLMQTVYVSRPPVLLNGYVTPVSGNLGRVFEYSVTYRDPDNDPPAFIKLVIDNGAPIEIGVPQPGADYISGVVYSYPLLKGTLLEGLHNFYFMASDGNGYAWYDQDVRDQETANNPDPHKSSTNSTPPTPIRPIDQPSVHSNNAPTLVNGIVTPTTGFDLDTYTYTVTYKDPNGDDPEYVECYIDDPNPNAPIASRAYKMTMDPLLLHPDFVAGVNYSLTKTGLATGSHTYYFRASDWLSTAYFPTNGTSVLIGPSIGTRSVATINISAPTAVSIGDSVEITGTVTGYNNTRLADILLTLKLTKPDGTMVTPQPTVTTDSNGEFTYPEGSAPWKPSVTGTWKVQASWAGNTQYLLSTSVEKTITVAGPSYTVSGLDMISIPIQPLSSFPDGVLGTTPAFALAKWQPSRLKYKMYSLLPGIPTDYDFSGVMPGQGFWIKTLTPKTIAPTGTLVDPYTDYTVALDVGWNQIGYPFTVEGQWSGLKVRRTINNTITTLSMDAAGAAGWVKEYGWAYDTSSGNYKLVDSTRSGAERIIRPWRGYWIKANMYCTVVIPAPSRGSRSSSDGKLSSVAAQPVVSSNPAKWQVQMMAKNGDLKDEFNYLGASRGDDDRMESPRCFQNYVDLYFTDAKDGMFAGYLKRNVAAGEEWQFTVATDKAGEVELTWDGLENVPSSIRLVLVDEKGETTDMIGGGVYKFTAGEGGETKTFRVRIEKS